MQGTASPRRSPRAWSRSTSFLALGIVGNAILSLLDLARNSASLWHAVPIALGSAPNFFAVPAIAFTCLGLMLRPEFRALVPGINDSRLSRTCIAVAVVGLLIWEYLQRSAIRMRFDWIDILATLLAGIVCTLVASRVLSQLARRISAPS